MKNKIKFYIINFIKIYFVNNDFNLIFKENINKILIIRLDEIGDIVLTTPFLRELRKNYPNARITLIVKPQTYNLVELCPYVDEILTFKRYGSRFSFFVNILKAYTFAKKFLQKEKFDLAIIPRWDTDVYGASYLAYFSKAERRVAYSENVSPIKARENKGFDRFFTDVIKDTKHLHEVERNLDVIRFLGGNVADNSLEIKISEQDKTYSLNILRNKDCLYIVFCPTAGSKHREWDILKYCEALNLLNKKFNINVVVLGDVKNTLEVLIKLKKNFTGEIIDLVGKTTLRETAALMMKADIYLGGDTGPMHIAAACKIDGVVISCHPQTGDINHGNSPKRFGPWQSPLIVIQPKTGLDDCKEGCNKTHPHCINQITVQQVYDELEKILNKKLLEKNGGKQ